MRSRLFALALAALILAGCGGSSPTSPSQSSPPPPAAAAAFTGASGLKYTTCTGATAATGSCGFSAQAQNRGNACAVGLHGTLSIIQNGQTVASADWSYTGVIEPQQTVTYAGCCIPYNVANALPSYSYTSTFQWTDDPSCQ